MKEQDRCVFVANGEAQAQQVCAFLRASGINASVRGESLRKIHALSVGRLGAVQILVSADDEDQAKALLASVEAGEFQLPDDDTDNDSP